MSDGYRKADARDSLVDDVDVQQLAPWVAEGAACRERAQPAARNRAVQVFVARVRLCSHLLGLRVIGRIHVVVCGCECRRICGCLKMAAIEVRTSAVDREADESEQNQDHQRNEHDGLAALHLSRTAGHQYSVR